MADWDADDFDPDADGKLSVPKVTDKWDGEDEDDDIKWRYAQFFRGSQPRRTHFSPLGTNLQRSTAPKNSIGDSGKFKKKDKSSSHRGLTLAGSYLIVL